MKTLSSHSTAFLLKAAIAILMLTGFTFNAQSQSYCSGFSKYPSSTRCVGISYWDSYFCNWAGEYHEVDGLLPGYTYVVTNCGSSSWDSNIEAYTTWGASLGFNDDACGLQSSVTFTAPSNGYARFNIGETYVYSYCCGTNWWGSCNCTAYALAYCGTNTSCTYIDVYCTDCPSTTPAPYNLGAAVNCGTDWIYRDNPPDGLTYYWQGTNSSGTSTSNSSSSYTVTSTGTYYLRGRDDCGNWLSSSSIYVPVDQSPSGGSLSIGDNVLCGSESSTLSLSGYSGSIERWEYRSGTSGSWSTYNSTSSSVSTNNVSTGAGTWQVRVRVESANGVCSDAFSNIITFYRESTAGSAGASNSSYWYVSCYSTDNFTGYYGYYTQNGYSFDTRDRWTSSPSDANGSGGASYNGCTIDDDNHSYRYRRSGFACGYYRFDLANHDNQMWMYVNGSQVYTLTGYGNSVTGIWTGWLDPSDVVEFRCSEQTGGSRLAINVVDVTPNLNASASTTGNVSCNGGSDGSVSASASGGRSPYSYNWSGGLGGGSSHSGVSAGTYTVTVTDACGETSTASTSVSQPSAVSFSTSKTDVSCNGASTGQIVVNAGGGTPGYQYRLNGGSWQGSNTFSGLSAGTYQIRVRDNNNCVAGPTNVTITQPNALSFTTTVNNVACYGGNDGSITVNASGGSGSYQYSRNGGASWQGSNIFNGLSAGTYPIRIRDANTTSCQSSNTNITVNEPAAIVLSGSQNPSTCGNSDGEASVSVSNGSAPFSYAWSNGGSGSTITNLLAGSYSVTVTDNNGCTATTSVNVTDLGSPTASISGQTDLNCYGGSNGSATVTFSGGTANYDIQWSTGFSQTLSSTGSSTVTGLSAGLVSVTITDANNCVATANTTITEPTEITFTTSVSDVSCFGGASGEITVIASGGSGSYDYSNNGGSSWQGSNTFSGLAAGNYDIRVRDASVTSCQTAISTVTVDEPTSALSLSTTQTNVSCNGGNNGAIDLTVNGGTPPYTYVWDNGPVSEDISGLTAGFYSVVVNDANGCTDFAFVTITEPTAVTFSTTHVDVNCHGDATGSITVTASGGTGTLEYSKDGGSNYQSSNVFSGLSAGTYDIRVNDANNCETAIEQVVIDEPSAAMSLTTNATDIDCYGDNTGEVSSNVSGGTLPYSYNWTGTGGPYSTANVQNLVAGTYDLTVTDDNGCTISGTETVNQATILGATASITNVTGCYGNSNGEVTFTPSGGSGDYEFSLDGGSNYQSSATFSSLAAGTYSAWIRDANVPSCEVQLANVIITEPGDITAPTLPGGNSYSSCGLIVVNATPGSGASQVIVYEDAAYTTPVDTNTAFVFNTLSAGNYTFYAKSYDPVDDCESSTATSFTIDVSNPVLLSGNLDNVTCYGDQDGEIDLVVNGGNAPYTYQWNNGASTQDLTNLNGGFYTVKVTDVNGCFNIRTFSVLENTPVTAQTFPPLVNGFNIDCNGSTADTVAVQGYGGAGNFNYDYLWSDGSTDAVRINDMVAGSYSVTVSDSLGCSTVKNVNLYEPPALTAALGESYECAGGGGYTSATVSVYPSGGASPYEYSIDGGTFQSSNEFSGLADGSSHTFEVKDALGCTESTTTTINFPPANVPVGDCDYIHVASAMDGGDPNNIGTPDCPTTLDAAMTYVTSTRNYIKMLGGSNEYTYSTSINLVDDVIIDGGYEINGSNEWVKNSSLTSIVNFDGAYNNPATGIGYYAGFVSNSTDNWTLQDVTLKVQMSGASGTQDGQGRSIYGILINNNSSGYNIARVDIQTGDASNGDDGTDGEDGDNGVAGSIGSAGQFISDATGGAGPFPSCCGGGTGGTGGDGAGLNAGTGETDPGPLSDGSNSSCIPKGSSAQRSGGGGGAGGTGGSTDGLSQYDGFNSGAGGNGGYINGSCTHNAAGANEVNGSASLSWDFYNDPYPGPTNAGSDGLDGADGDDALTSYSPGNQPGAYALNEYFVPGAGNDGSDGYGGAGGSGGGGAGSAVVDGRSGSPSFYNVVRGSGGGGGGSGAEGGAGGAGAGGGGSVFGIYVSSTALSGANIQNVTFTSIGAAGNGGNGGNGGQGGVGGQGGQGGPTISDTDNGVIMTGKGGDGGDGGSGGDGGRGQDGDDGLAQNFYYGGGAAPTQTPFTGNGTVTVNAVKGCTNSEIEIVKTSGDDWTILSGGSFVNDLTATTSSYNVSSTTAKVYYTSTGSKDVQVGSTNYPGFIYIRTNRALPAITSAPFGTICQGATIDLTTSATGISYEWEVAPVSSPGSPIFTGTAQNIPNVQINTAGTFQVKLKVKEECCGWSIPVYEEVIVSPLPDDVVSVSGPASVCVGETATFSTALVANASANTSSSTGYTWLVPPGATITSAGGVDGVTSGGTNSITVQFGSTSGNVDVTPSNSCGSGNTYSHAVTVDPTPTITSIDGPGTMCTGTNYILTALVSGGSGNYDYLWNNGATTQAITVSPGASTTYSVTVSDQAGSGCADSESKAVTVLNTPAAAGTITGDNNVLFQESGVTYSISAVPNATSYTWTVPPGATIVSGQGTTSITVDFGSSDGNVTVTPENSICSGTSSSLFVDVDNPAHVWQGNISGDWHTGGNWNVGTVPTATDNAIVPGGRPNYPINYGGVDAEVKTLIVQSGGEIHLTDPNADLNVNDDLFINSGGWIEAVAVGGNTASVNVDGNWVNDGTFDAASGLVSFDAGSAQTIYGYTEFHSVEINNSNGVTIDGAATARVYGELQLIDGVLTTNDNLVIASNSTKTGLIDDFSAGHNGTLSGNITMERYVTNTSAPDPTYYHIGSPIDPAGLDLSDQLNGIDLSFFGYQNGHQDYDQVIPQPDCNPDNVAYGSPYGHMFQWEEDAPFLYNCTQSGWYVRRNGTFENGRGYAALVNAGTNVISFEGPATTGPVSYNNSNYGTGSLENTNSTGDGFHLVSNPFPSPMEWTGVAGFDAAAYFWQSSGAYSGTYQVHLSSQNYVIPSMQGFFVRVTSGSHTFSVDNSMRRTGDPSFNQNAAWYEQILNLEINGNGYADLTTIYFQDGATPGWDSQFDAKKFSSAAGQPTLYTKMDSSTDILSYNAYPSLTAPVTVPMGLNPGSNGSYTISADDLGSFSSSALIYLEDLKTGTIQNLKQNPDYTFTADVNDDEERFLVHFYPPVALSSTEADCEGDNATVTLDFGVFELAGQTLVWDTYSLTDVNGNVVDSGTNTNGQVVISSNISEGEYTLTAEIDGFEATETVDVYAMDPVSAQFTASNNTVNVGESIVFTNASTGANYYEWEFGDGSFIGGIASPAHSYTSAGTYEVVMRAENEDCEDEYSVTVVVEDVDTVMTNIAAPDQPIVNIYSFRNNVVVEFENFVDKEVTMSLLDIVGRKVIYDQELSTLENRHVIPVNDIVSGYYFVRLEGESGTHVQQVYLDAGR